MNKLIIFEKISFGIIIILAFIGIVFVSGLFHEFTHYFDIHKYTNEGDYICAFAITTNFSTILQNPIAYYEYSLNMTKDKGNLTLYENTEKYTELKAYSIQLIIVIMFLLCISLIFKRRNDLISDEDLLNQMLEVMKDGKIEKE
jgi:hypothetical protein